MGVKGRSSSSSSSSGTQWDHNDNSHIRKYSQPLMGECRRPNLGTLCFVGGCGSLIKFAHFLRLLFKCFVEEQWLVTRVVGIVVQTNQQNQERRTKSCDNFCEFNELLQNAVDPSSSSSFPLFLQPPIHLYWQCRASQVSDPISGIRRRSSSPPTLPPP